MTTRGAWRSIPLTESKEAHEHQDDHSVQEVVRVAYCRHRPAGSFGCLSATERRVILISQQTPTLLILRHVRLFGICKEENWTAGYVFRSYDLARMSRDFSCTRAGSWTKPTTFVSSEKPLVAGLNTENRLKLQLRQLSEEEELSSTRKYGDKTEQNN